jgi:hypothetical protein
MPRATYGTLIDIRNGEAVVIACSEADASRGLKQILLDSRFARRAAGAQPVTVGISLDVTEISRLPVALEEARIAIEFTGAAQPLMHFADIDLPGIPRSPRRQCSRALDPGLGAAARHEQGRSIARVVPHHPGVRRQQLQCQADGRRLNVHANTVYFRLTESPVSPD